MDTLSLAKEARIYNGKKIVSSISGARKTDNCVQGNEIRTLPNITQKDKLNMD